MEKVAVIAFWTESERGFGSRPDGVTIHLTKEDNEDYVSEYWSTMPDETPDEYCRPTGGQKVARISDDLYKRVEETENGLVLHEVAYKELLNEEIEFVL